MGEQRIIKKTRVFIEGDGIELVDTIEYDKKLWLVPIWREQSVLKRKRPERLVRLDCLSHEKTGKSDVEYLLDEKLPKSLFDDAPLRPQETRFEVLESPDIWFEIGQSEEQ